MLKSPRAAMAIPACGVCNFRVRRLQSPRAAFGISVFRKGELRLDDALDVVEEFVFAQFRLAARDEVRREFFPLLRELGELVLDVRGELAFR